MDSHRRRWCEIFESWYEISYDLFLDLDIHQTALKNAARLHLTKNADLERLLYGAKEELDIALLRVGTITQSCNIPAIYVPQTE
jgi:hypothetical protein